MTWAEHFQNRQIEVIIHNFNDSFLCRKLRRPCYVGRENPPPSEVETRSPVRQRARGIMGNDVDSDEERDFQMAMLHGGEVGAKNSPAQNDSLADGRRAFYS